MNHLPPEITALNQWVCVWNNSKTPMQATVRKGASSVDPTTWSDYETASNAVAAGIYDQVGFVFNNNGIVGIDIDCGFDEDGFLSEVSRDVVTRCQSYTEKSRSGRGIHVLTRGTLPFPGKNNRAGVEIYQSRRFFILTGDILICDKITENQAAIDYILDRYFPESRDERTGQPTNAVVYQPLHTKPEGGSISLTPTYPPIPSGMRNLSLTSLAGQRHNQGYSKREIYRELLHANSVACTPPLSVSEIETIVNSVTRYRR